VQLAKKEKKKKTLNNLIIAVIFILFLLLRYCLLKMSLRQDRPFGLLEKYQLSKQLTKAYGTINMTAHCYHPTCDSSTDLDSFYTNWLYPTLTRLIIDHPMLSAIVRDKTNNSVHWAQLSHINLANNVTILPIASVPIETLIQEQTRTEFDLDSELPLWRLTILPDVSLNQCWLTITVHHVIADGMSLSIFLKQLIRELNHQGKTTSNSQVVVPQTKPLPAAYEDSGAPTISVVWDVVPVLCRSLIPKILPISLATWMDPITFTGWQGDYAAIDGESHNTVVQLIKVPASQWQPLLKECKERNISPHALVFVAMVKAWAHLYKNQTTEVSTPVNCRGLCHPPVGADQIGNYTGAYTSVWTSNASITEDTWAMATRYAQGLKAHKIDAAKQALLLKYLPEFPESYCDFWYDKRKSSRMGRTGGLELSDLGKLITDKGAWGVLEQEVYFCQSAQVFTAALGMNAVTVDQGALCCTVSWQKGALDERKVNLYRDQFVAILKAL
jgi:NRPS condensation-like uncharacterized protein